MLKKLETVPVMQIGIGNAGNSEKSRWIGYLSSDGGWPRFAERWIPECKRRDVTEIELHNPFGHRHKKGQRVDMQFFQYSEALHGVEGSHPPLPWVVQGFVGAMRTFEQEGINVEAYVGSLHQIPDGGPKADWQKWLRTALDELHPILDSCEKIGFDATFDFSADSKIAAFITTMRLNGHDVYLEPWPLKGSTHVYGNRFHCRELFYRKIRPHKKWASLDDLKGKALDIRRQIPSLNDLAGDTLQEAVTKIQADGHVAIVKEHMWDTIDY